MTGNAQNVPDISKLSLGELTQLADQIAALKSDLLVRRRQELATHIKELAAAEGISLRTLLDELNASPDLLVGAARRRNPKSLSRRGKVAAKYRNPTDSSQTWTGRGRKPHWVQAHLGKGGVMDDLLIR